MAFHPGDGCWGPGRGRRCDRYGAGNRSGSAQDHGAGRDRRQAEVDHRGGLHHLGDGRGY